MPILLISVRFHDGRYHGSGEWPPSPARLFQALVAGAARGHDVSARAVEALEWLETLAAPVIAAPRAYYGSSFRTYVPNNDLDALGGDPARIGDIRTAKIVHPRHFDAGVPLIYAWTCPDNDRARRHAPIICDIACSLYQLGRGVDMAWAQGEVVGEMEVSTRFGGRGSIVWRPGPGGGGLTLACPQASSFASLTVRFKRMRERFTTVGKGRKVGQHFAQPPKPSFNQVVYGSPSLFLLYDVRQDDAFAPQSFERVVELTEAIRDGAAARMTKGLPDRIDLVDRILVGRDAKEPDKARRLRITPLPTIGHAQAVRSIRRVLITVPPDCPIEAGDVGWMFSGLPLGIDPATGEVPEEGAMLVQARDRSMLDHYGIGSGSYRRWRSVTPAALPQRAARRRIDPGRRREEAKGSAERLREQAAAESAVRQALRHAGVDAGLQAIRVQREPFESKGKRAEAFASARFRKERLWHVEITLREPVPGPILLGDGRYLGLGLLAPILRHDGIWSLDIEDGLASQAEPLELTRALRRAVMARVQRVLGERATLPVFFTGHEPGGARARSGAHKHLAFVFDALRRRLVVVSPHILERREASSGERTHLRTLADALEDLRELRAGRSGRLAVATELVAMQDDPLLARSTTWKSLTDYRVTRHAKAESAAAALAADVLAECYRVGLPRPRVAVDKTHPKPGMGLYGRATLEFRAAVAGPILLGRDRHFGGGLFAPVLNSDESRRKPA